VTVVNIDNGFGGGYAAGVIARQSRAVRAASRTRTRGTAGRSRDTGVRKAARKKR